MMQVIFVVVFLKNQSRGLIIRKTPDESKLSHIRPNTWPVLLKNKLTLEKFSQPED